MEYYTALKGQDILLHATAWITLEDIVLSNVSQSQKDKCPTILLIWDARRSHIRRDREQNGGSQGPGQRMSGELLFNK